MITAAQSAPLQRAPQIKAREGRVLIDIILEDGPVHRAARRRIVLYATAVAAWLRVSVDSLDVQALEKFARENFDLIRRRALELQQARTIIGHPPIDVPRGQDLPDLIFIREGEL